MKNFKINLNKKTLALFLAATMIPSTLTGCGKKAECNISESHAHSYTNEEGYVRYLNREHLKYEGYLRSDDFINIEGQEELYKFLEKKDLIRIDDNLELITNIQEQNIDYMEYRYRYTYMQPIPHTRKVGKVTSTYFTYIPVTRYSWTTNSNRSGLTGETRICHHVYTAYKIEKNEKGKYVLIPSEDVEDLTTVMEEFPFIKEKYTKIVTLDGKEADYEDGQEENLTDEEKQRIEEYTESEDKNKKLILK